VSATQSRDGLRARLEALFTNDPAAMVDPYPVFRELREAGPVHELGAMTLISRHADLRDAWRDIERLSSRTFLGSRAQEALSRMNDEQREAYRIVSEFEAKYVSRSDGEDHARRRRVMQRAFAPRRMAELRPRIQTITDDLLDAASDRDEVDLSGFAWRLPLMVVGELLEVGPQDIDRIHGWSAAIGRNRRGVDPEALMGALDAIGEFRVYVDEAVERQRRTPRESMLVGELLGAQDGDRLTAEELTAMFVILLFAGHETTTGLIANGLVELLRRPEQWRLLTDDPDIAPNAVEELLRFVSPVQWAWRLAAEPYPCAGTVIPAGTTVALMIAAANRDPDAFERPDELDLTRTRAGQHVAFGLGPHFCIGNALARLEAEIALRTLALRFPAMRLADHPLRWQGNAMLRQLAVVPVRLGRHAASVGG
jgi:cytochrome P450